VCDRWLALADKIGNRDLVAQAKGDSSDARFDAVMQVFRTAKPPALPAQQIKATDGKPIAGVARKGGKTVMSLNAKTSAGFDDWLIDNLPDIHRDWLKDRGE